MPGINSYRENLGTPDYPGDSSDDDDSLPIFSEDTPLAQHRFRPWMPAVGQPEDTPWIFDDLKRSPKQPGKQQAGFLRAARSSFQACSHRLLGMLEMVCSSRNSKRSGKVADSYRNQRMIRPNFGAFIVSEGWTEPANMNWTTSAVEASKTKTKRDLVSECCRHACTKRQLIGYCHYVGY